MPDQPPRGLSAMTAFLLFATAMATLAGTTLARPGTALDRIWALNPDAYSRLVPLGRAVGAAFLLFAAVLLVAAIGWARRRFWGWILTVVIIATQLLGDAANLIRRDYLRGAVGVVIAGALLLWLCHARVRSAFSR